MSFDWLKTLSPRSLIGRTALILLVPILTIQLVVSYVFIQRLYENVTDQMTRSMAASLKVITAGLDAAPDRAAALDAVADDARLLRVDVAYDVPMPQADSRRFYDLSGRVVIQSLRENLDGVGPVFLDEGENLVHMVIETRHGPALLSYSRRRVSASNPHQLLVLMVFVSTVVTLISFLFLKNQVRPIRRLAEAALAFGKGRVVPYQVSGATEVRLAGRSFLQMRDRIERHIEQRTLMLSGVSHDLRTPITRMKLEVSMMEDRDTAAALSRDLAEMQHMLDTFLDFARVDATETQEIVDPADLARRLVDRLAADGAAVSCVAPQTGQTVALRPMAVERAVDNLLRNALRHGAQARLTVEHLPDKVSFIVEDDGPGIPAGNRDDVMRPFFRLDESRNQDKGGSVGLGLSIVRDIARQHGGMLELGDSADLGGLRAAFSVAR